MKHKFKVGDKVKVVKSTFTGYVKGTVGVIVSQGKNKELYEVEGKYLSQNITLWHHASDLSLIKEQTIVKFIPFDLDKVKRGDGVYVNECAQPHLKFFDYDGESNTVILNNIKEGIFFGMPLSWINFYFLKVEQEIPTTAHGFVNLYYNQKYSKVVSSGGSIHPTREAAEHFGKVGLDNPDLVYIGTVEVSL